MYDRLLFLVHGKLHGSLSRNSSGVVIQILTRLSAIFGQIIGSSVSGDFGMID